jgi:AcrR family transcriptional regulator
MAENSIVKPNRRGVKSREQVLDAAERVMAEHGFEAATLARVVEESGIPASSVYHYFGSKDGILLAVMERGAERFFADLPDGDQRIGEPAEHLDGMLASTVETLECHPDFLRLLLGFAAQPPLAGGGKVHAVVGRVREMALKRLRKQLALAFDANPRSKAIDQLARFSLAAIDGAFIASHTDPGVSVRRVLEPLVPVLAAAGAMR